MDTINGAVKLGSIQAESLENEPSNISSGIPDGIIRAAVKSLIALAPSAIEADRVVRRYKVEFDRDETLEIVRGKYFYVLNLFNISAEDRAACNPHGASDLDKALTDYYSLLSVLILRKWG